MYFSHSLKKILRILFISIFLNLSISSLSFAQSNIKISGTVVSEDNGNPVSFAVIKIANTNYLTQSDNSGNFLFANIPVGLYNLEIDASGFEKKTIPDIETSEDITRKIRINLKRKTYFIPGIEVTAEKRPLPSFEAEILTRGEIEKLKAKTVAEALESIEGIFIQKTGTVGGKHQVSIRGSSPKQVLVLIDGQRINPSGTGVADLSTIPLEMVERIEVYKSGASAKFGADALGGAINVITQPQRIDKDSRMKMDNLWGSWNTEVFGISFKNPFVLENLSTNFSYSYKYSRSDFEYEKPYQGKVKRENSYKKGVNLFLSGIYNLNPKTNLTFSGQLYQSKNGIPGAIFEEEISSGARVEDKRKLLNLKLKRSFSNKLSAQMQFALSRFQQHFQNLNLPSNLLSLFGYDSRYVNDIYDLHLLLDFNFLPKNNLRIGSEFKKDLLDHKDLKFPQRSIGEVKRETKSFFVSDDQNLTLPDFFVFESLWLNFHLRQDNTKNLKDFTSPKVGLALSRGKKIQIILRGNYGKSFRQPSNNALFWKEDVYASGNPDLKPEKSEHSEIGFEFKVPLFSNSKLSLGSTYFHNSVKDIIIWRKRFDGKYVPQNISRSRMTGHDDFVSLEFFGKAAKIDYRNNATQAINKSGDKTYDGKLIPFQPRYVTDLNISIDYKLLQLSCKNRWVSERYRTEANTLKENPYHLVDLSFGLKKRIYRWEVMLNGQIKNLTNEKYFLIERYPMPGREWGLDLEIVYNLRN